MRFSILHLIVLLILIISVVVSGFGLFYNAEPVPRLITNQYGDLVTLYGSGVYAQDSYFRAPIFRGTDLIVLFIACPLLLYWLLQDLKNPTYISHQSIISLIGVFVYYAANISFGVTYNHFHLLYIFLFSACFYGLIVGLLQVKKYSINDVVINNLPLKGINAFLIFTGIALILAWLPDIIISLISKRPLLLIENYTTEVTYVLDMGILAPLCFICQYLLKKKDYKGYIILDLLLTLCIIIGIMLPVQTIFQLNAGIEIPIGALITKISSFCLLAVFAFYLKRKLKIGIITINRIHETSQVTIAH